MPTNGFVKAVRKQAKGRIVLVGPTGSGKTMTALMIASAFGERIAVVDTEHQSASLYAGEEGVPDFDVMELPTHHYQNYIKAIRAAEEAGYDVLVIDSLTHAWTGKDGILAQKDQATARSTKGNSFTDGWGKATPMHNELIDAIIHSKIHIICTMRSIMKYILEEDEKGKQRPKKVGMGAVQRKDMEYEFHLVGELDQDHRLVVTKSRILPVSDMVVLKAGKEFGAVIAAYLAGGEAVKELPEEARSEIDSNEKRIEAEKEHVETEINKQELLLSIQDVLTAKAGNGPMSRKIKAGLCAKHFGSEVQLWDDVIHLTPEELTIGLNKLKGQ